MFWNLNYTEKYNLSKKKLKQLKNELFSIIQLFGIDIQKLPIVNWVIFKKTYLLGKADELQRLVPTAAIP